MIEAALRTRAAVMLALVLAALTLGGCASVPANPDDPLERFNRAMFSFNEGVDKAVLKPAAEVYETITPRVVRNGVGNFLGNLGDPWIAVNNILQGKVADGVSDLTRFVVNSTLGLLGVLDVATEMGLNKNDEDFGQTLAVWGVGEGPFVVLPLFGPSTTRDAVALPVDWQGTLIATIDHVPTRNQLYALRAVHRRYELLGAEKTLEEGSLDKYAFMRDFHLQQRRYRVRDGDVPLEYEDFDNGVSMLPVRGEADAMAELAVESLELVSLLETRSELEQFVIR